MILKNYGITMSEEYENLPEAKKWKILKKKTANNATSV